MIRKNYLEWNISNSIIILTMNSLNKSKSLIKSCNKIQINNLFLGN
jgi:hypothetical protein